MSAIFFQRISDFLARIPYNFDYCLVGTKSRFEVEYLPDFEKSLEFFTGFNGSNGFLFLSKNLNEKSFFFTDGRYLLQAEKQLGEIKQLEFEIINLISEDFKSFSFKENVKIIFNSRVFSDLFFRQFDRKNIEFIGLDFDFYKLSDQNYAINKKDAFIYDEKYSDLNYLQKFDLLQNSLFNDIYFFTCPSSICWLLNIRGEDIEYNLIFLCYGIFYKKQNKLEIFCQDKNKLSSIKEWRNIEIFEFDDLEYRLSVIEQKIASSENISMYFKKIIGEKLLIEKDPCSLLRSRKTNREILNAKKVHIEDGIAVLELWKWIEDNVREDKDVIDEISICQKIKEFREKRKGFFKESFDTIAGFDENGAFIHYKVSENTNKILNKNGLLLVDSGGHYFGGTTDITRVFYIRQNKLAIPKIIKYHYTLVLKSHLKILRAIFPYETPMHQLNSVARMDLWQECLDFHHGFGHGVSNFLEVHESPYSINNRNTEKLVENIILSNEPGLYFKDKYGIRIENLMFSKIAKINSETNQQFVGFENLTYVPYENNLIDASILDEAEIAQINKYHAACYKKLSKNIIDKTLLRFLKKKTKKIKRS